MEAARVASLRGHQVTLFEKTDRLGGQLVLASKPPGKYKIDWFRDYLMRQLSKQNIEISLNTDVTSELVESIQPDVVILATGSEPVVPDIPGIRDRRVTTARDVLAESVKITDKNVVVCGGGMVGAETAEFLAEQGNSVSVIEQFPYIAYDIELLHRKALVDSLREKGVVLLTERKLVGVAEGHVLVEPSRLTSGAFRPQSIQFESS
jgi:NADPH-dependent 2,4-dienoyl-CoA reductase/sulfur reductase-like enzyme